MIIDTTPELFNFRKRRDRASRLLSYIGEVLVNGHPDLKGRTKPDLSHLQSALPRHWPATAGAAQGSSSLMPEASALSVAGSRALANPIARPGERIDLSVAPPPGSRQLLRQLGPVKFAEWMRASRRVLITDTTMRDAHQSLLATRVRTYDILAVADAVARLTPDLFSLEMWGGATFDTSMRFLQDRKSTRLNSSHRT